MTKEGIEEGLQILEMILGQEEVANTPEERFASVIDLVSEEVMENWLLRTAMRFHVTDSEYETFASKVASRLENIEDEGEVPEVELEKIIKEIRETRGDVELEI